MPKFVRSFLEAFAGGDVEATKAMMADDYVFHFPFVDGLMDQGSSRGCSGWVCCRYP